MDFGNKSFFNLKLTSLKMFIKGISLNCESVLTSVSEKDPLERLTILLPHKTISKTTHSIRNREVLQTNTPKNSY